MWALLRNSLCCLEQYCSLLRVLYHSVCEQLTSHNYNGDHKNFISRSRSRHIITVRSIYHQCHWLAEPRAIEQDYLQTAKSSDWSISNSQQVSNQNDRRQLSETTANGYDYGYSYSPEVYQSITCAQLWSHQPSNTSTQTASIAYSTPPALKVIENTSTNNLGQKNYHKTLEKPPLSGLNPARHPAQRHRVSGNVTWSLPNNVERRSKNRMKHLYVWQDRNKS